MGSSKDDKDKDKDSYKGKDALDPDSNPNPNATLTETQQSTPQPTTPQPIETDDFGLPIRQFVSPQHHTKEDHPTEATPQPPPSSEKEHHEGTKTLKKPQLVSPLDPATSDSKETNVSHELITPNPSNTSTEHGKTTDSTPQPGSPAVDTPTPSSIPEIQLSNHDHETPKFKTPLHPRHRQEESIASMASLTNETALSDFSHQQLTTEPEAEKKDEDDGWQTMPAYARYDMYDDDDRLIAREHDAEEDEKYVYGGLGGAGRGYTRVQLDEDAQSATSMDDNTNYLFKDATKTTAMAEEEDDDQDGRDAISQMQATKDLLTEGQRIAYVGVVRLEIAAMVKEGEDLESTKNIKKEIQMAAEALKMWGQKMMIRLYSHMDISEAEQVMIEQLAHHGVVPADLTPTLHANSRVQNPMAGQHQETDAKTESTSPPSYDDDEKAASSSSRPGNEKSASPPSNPNEKSVSSLPDCDNKKAAESRISTDEELAEPPPPYESHAGDKMPDVKTPSQLPSTEKIDIDLRWTVLCDLFLILIADSVYDSRSRVLLERVGKSLEIPWIDICRFEKRVTDALEMQQAAEKENWNEDEHMENRRKRALKKRYMMMGLATVGGGLVIGLSAGLLAPVIGAGLAAGFTTIGVAGTSGFLGGVGGAAIITSTAVTTGGIVGVRAANRRTGAVKTFEYRPLHNNKRVNLIVSVSGWLTGKADDVRLPFSTVDPTMGDIYSVLWEPDLLRLVGDLIRLVATEALTTSIQQVLGGTVLHALMGAIQLPVILTKLSYLIDNPWTVSLDRAVSAGQILADSLIERNLGTRPITLVGYSLGARVIFSCLQELAKRGAYGLIQNVYMFGSPIVVSKEEYLKARTVVAGRFVNGYNRTDWILGYFFRLTNGGIRRVAGLAAIEDLPWIENIDVTDMVSGHMEYRTAMPKLLKATGWMVESEEFTEIEDPDPDNHNERQRELINEIEEARRTIEKEGNAKRGSRFGIFGRKKKIERAEWELYEDSTAKEVGSEDKDKNRDSAYQGALFDIDAIRAELAKEAARDGRLEEEELQVREIPSTLPPMKLDLSPNRSANISTAHGSLRETRSAEHVPVNDEISMTFDTTFNHHRPPTPPPKDDLLTRPGMRSSQTLPNIQLNDPWGDPDDEDFGKEQEISMTFA